MFTGLVTDVGVVREVEQRADLRVMIGTGYDMQGVSLGASIACSGVCLTVVDKGADWFAVDVSGETLGRTAPGQWVAGKRLNLERSLRLGDEMGGHIVSGHVDGLGTVQAVREEGGSHRVQIVVDSALAPYLAAKGSVAVDGVSLTVNSVEDAADGTCVFGLNIIPHTWSVTALGDLKKGLGVNIEIDMLARYLGRMQEAMTYRSV